MNKEKDIRLYLENNTQKLDDSLKEILSALSFVDTSNYSLVTTIFYFLSRYYEYGMKLYEKLSSRAIKN